jgi:leucyl/phenylalanyl-tRNA---protein transferase
VQAPYWLTEDKKAFPDPNLALGEPDGLLAIGGDLSPERLIAAYSQGIFPWYSENQPILWWSPNPRTILEFKDYHVSRSLQKFINKAQYTVSFDKHFSEVMEACQQPRPNQDGTWITSQMKEAYQGLFVQGYAHSVEITHEGKLLGGLYGVSLGQAFFGESMFSNQDNGSKLALYHLIEKLKCWGFKWLDCQVWSNHLGTLGAKTIPRKEFLALLQASKVQVTKLGPWDLL